MVKHTLCFFVLMPLGANLNGALFVRGIFSFVLGLEYMARAQSGGIGGVGGGGGLIFEIFSGGVLRNFLNPDGTSKKTFKVRQTRKEASPRIEIISQQVSRVYARFNEEDTIFQLYSRVITMSCHKDVTLAVFIPKIISIWYTMNKVIGTSLILCRL